MAFKVETGLLNPETSQYAGKGSSMISIEHVATESARLERLGFDGLCAPEAGHDPFLALAIAAGHTERVTLGTNVAIAFPRSPMATAQMAWDLQQYSGGRFELGLGTQVKGHNERRYATPWTAAPGPRMREYLECMRAMFDSFGGGGKVEAYQGQHYSFTMLPPFFDPGPIDHARPPVYVAAVNPYMCRLAGELCDGVRLHPIGTFAYTRDRVVPLIAEGAARTGRELGAVNVVGAPFLALGRDQEELVSKREALKQQISFYASTRTYAAPLEFHGWEEAGAELHRLSKEGKWTEMPGVISDAMLDEWAVSATWDNLAERLTERCQGVYDTILLDLPAALSREEDRVAEILAKLHASG